jgi:hypothetical protein
MHEQEVRRDVMDVMDVMDMMDGWMDGWECANDIVGMWGYSLNGDVYRR